MTVKAVINKINRYKKTRDTHIKSKSNKNILFKIFFNRANFSTMYGQDDHSNIHSRVDDFHAKL